MLRAIQRHREVVQDHSREFQRTKVLSQVSLTLFLANDFAQKSVRNALDQANLLSGVRNDIEYVVHRFPQ